MVAI